MRRLLLLSSVFLLTSAVFAAPPEPPQERAFTDTATPPSENSLFFRGLNIKAVQPPEVAPAPKVKGPMFVVLGNDKKVRLVDRDAMRIKTPGTRTLKIPLHLPAVAATLPQPPPAWDWSRARATKYPILGNDQYGDCYAVALVHCIQTMMALNGTAYNPTRAEVVKWYLSMSPQDNGLSDSDVFPAWKRGVVPPLGKHVILDYMVIDPTDANGINLGGWCFGGTIYTADLLRAWLNNPRPGDTWDSGSGLSGGGHAMHLSARNADGTWADETWGFDPPIRLTQKGLQASDPEIVVYFSLDWFDPKTGFAPNGLHYVELAQAWVTLGGHTLPPNPFPGPTPPPKPPVPPDPPKPPVPPIPPTPGLLGDVTIQTDAGPVVVSTSRKIVQLPPGWKSKGEVLPSLVSELLDYGVPQKMVDAVLLIVQAAKDGVKP